jgi:hypothetical protein
MIGENLWEVNTITANLVKKYLDIFWKLNFHYLRLLYSAMYRSVVWQTNTVNGFLPEYTASIYSYF